MRHQPYEKWIIEKDDLAQDQRKELQSHLSDCDTCARLADASASVERVLSRTVIASAPAGFTTRWMSSLAARKQDQEKKQARAMLISFSSIAIGLFLAAGILLIPEFSFISLAANTLSVSVNLLNGLDNFWTTVSQLVQVVPPGIIILTGVFISSWIILACVIWGLSIWKLAFRRGKTK